MVSCLYYINFAIRYGRLPNYNKGFTYTKAL